MGSYGVYCHSEHGAAGVCGNKQREKRFYLLLNTELMICNKKANVSKETNTIHIIDYLPTASTWRSR